MGNSFEVPSHRRPLGRLDKIEIKICCQQLFNHLHIQVNKRAEEFKAKELEIGKLLKTPYFDRTDLGLNCQSALKNLKYIKACKIVMKACKVIEEKAQILEIVVGKGAFNEIDYLMPYIESIIWSTTYLNLQQIKPFTAMIYNYFGPTVFSEVKAFKRVDPELKSCKEDSTSTEISNYLEGVITRHSIPNINVKEILSEVKTSYNPFNDIMTCDQSPLSNVTQPTVSTNDSNDAQIREVNNMVENFDLNRKYSARSAQSYFDVVKKLRAIGV